MKGKIIMLLTGLILLQTILVSAVDVGDQAPFFEYTDSNGDRVSLTDLAGNVIFIFVFGNQCPLCRAVGNRTEVEVNQIFKDNKNFRAIGIDTWDNSSSVTSVQAFISSTGITYPMFLHGGSFATLYATTYDRVLVIDQNGIVQYKGQTNVANTLSGAVAVIEELLDTTKVQTVTGSPGTFDLAQNYPNPFNPSTRIPFSLSSEAGVSLNIYDLLGNPVQTLAQGYFQPGRYTYFWQADNHPAGVYFYRLEVDGSIVTRKMIYQK